MFEEFFLSSIESRYLHNIKEIISPYSKERQNAILYPALRTIKEWYATYKARKSDNSGLYQNYIDFGNFAEDYNYRELWAIITVYQIIESDSSAWNSTIFNNKYEAYASSCLRHFLANKMNKILLSPDSYPKSLVECIYFHTKDLDE